MKILVLSSLSFSLTNFRGDLLEDMRRNGHDVIAAAPDGDPNVEQALARLSIPLRITPMQRTGKNPFSDLRLLDAYVRLMRDERPDIVLAYTQKPIVYGGLACRMVGIRKFYALMSGLGHAFSPETRMAGWLRKLISSVYRLGVSRADAVFVFNANDRADMIRLGILDPRQRTLQVPGSGVNVDRFAAQPIPTDAVRFLMIGRLMRDKGIFEFLEAAAALRAEVADCEFAILGRYERENPTGVDERQCDELAARYPVRFIPSTSDVRPYLADSSVFVLPSYYREGLPRTILEAMATGRPVITTDMPGCRDPIESGGNGTLIPPRDSAALKQAMRKFIDHPEMISAMGKRSRQIAEERYDVKIVNRMLLGEMGLLSAQRASGPDETPHSRSFEQTASSRERAIAHVGAGRSGS